VEFSLLKHLQRCNFCAVFVKKCGRRMSRVLYDMHFALILITVS